MTSNRFPLAFMLCVWTLKGATAQQPDSWLQKTSFPGVSRQQAVSFSINGSGYVFCGVDSSGNLLADGYRFDPVTDSWSTLNPFPGGARSGAAGFSINDSGYIATGFDGVSYLKDCWSYDPLSDSWTRLQDLGTYLSGSFPGRTSSTALTANGKAYLLCGYDGSSGYLKQVLCFDPANDTCWSLMANFANNTQGLNGRRWCTGFTIGNFLYFGTGFSFSQDIKKDFWRLDLTNNVWSQIPDFGGGFRSNAFGFSLYGKGYVGGGTDGSCENDLWRYDPIANSWVPVSSFGGGTRMNTYHFVIGNKAYSGAGSSNSSNGVFPLFNDCWEYTPDSTVGLAESLQGGWRVFHYDDRTVWLYAGPGTIAHATILELLTMDGKMVIRRPLNASENSLFRTEVAAGLYLFRVVSEGRVLMSGKLVF